MPSQHQEDRRTRKRAPRSCPSSLTTPRQPTPNSTAPPTNNGRKEERKGRNGAAGAGQPPGLAAAPRL
eukprot:15352852-Alexandrium_andersonii.AAC.1